MRQEITISRDGTDAVSYTVAGGALVLGFKLLFLRDPDPNQREGDIVIGVSSLATVCEARLGGSCAGLGVSEAGLGMSKLAAAAISGVSLDSQAVAISPENRFGHAFVCLLAFSVIRLGTVSGLWRLSLSERPDKDATPFGRQTTHTADWHVCDNGPLPI